MIPGVDFPVKRRIENPFFKAGERLGVDFLVMYKIESINCSSGGFSAPVGYFTVYLLNVKTKEIHDQEGQWTCESVGLEPGAVLKKLLNEHANLKARTPDKSGR